MEFMLVRIRARRGRTRRCRHPGKRNSSRTCLVHFFGRAGTHLGRDCFSAHLPVEVVLGKSFVRVRHQVRMFLDSEIIALQTCEDFFFANMIALQEHLQTGSCANA